ncbi:MAG: helix-turn-helix domain-containing protein [Sediminibacterium magnilacihabitans]|jgi:AraC-like DNA-binding protein|nr:helix-turn-helix domain-containing protein [Sediminibacterium magnilacihabitans]PQV61513.1 AraC family transcriptional regulator [Sediminibacterium magnilacihabitans]
MKIVPFKIPRSGNEAIRVQVDAMPHLYNHLHQHPEIQLTLVVESHGTLVASDYVGRFREGDVFVIGSNQPHVFRNDAVYFKKKLKAKAITLFFDESTLGNLFWQQEEVKSFLPFFRNSLGGYRFKGKKQEQLRNLLLQIAGAEKMDKIILFMEMIKLLSSKKETTALSHAVVQRPIRDFDGSRLNAVLEYTFRESHRTIRLEEIAAVANMTVVAFCKYFKTRTRKTYTHFLNEIRINNACKLLLAGDQPISTVCYETGFSNLSHFNRIFKKITGKTPGHYRASV